MPKWSSSLNKASLLSKGTTSNTVATSALSRNASAARNVAEARTKVELSQEGLRHTSSLASAASYSTQGYEDTFSLQEFKESCSIHVLEQSDSQITFDLIGADTAIVNALRRILLSEVPAAAIETVQIWQNTGVIQDEVLAHRLGLIPFAIDPDFIAFREENEELSDENAICFSLHVKCTPADVAPYQKFLPIYSKDLKWEPLSPAQRERFADNPPRVVEDKILITKLGCGQEIELKAYVEKGIGKTHAKWSPVCTAVYRLLPEFDFNANDPFNFDEANELVKLCPMEVFDIEDENLVAKNPRNCTSCRMCIERFPSKLKLFKLKNHFIFSIESTGAVSAAKLFVMAVQILKQKALSIKSNLEVVTRGFV